MKTETAKIENFTNIEAIKDKLKKEVTSLRDELKNYKANLLEEQERIDEEKMQRLELEEQISEMRKRIKTEATEKAKESGDLILFIGQGKSRYNYLYLRWISNFIIFTNENLRAIFSKRMLIFVNGTSFIHH